MSYQGHDKAKILSANQFIHKAAFVRGFNEVKKGIPMDYNAYSNDMFHACLYEYGRLFGCIFNGNLKDGKKVTYDAVIAFNNAARNGYIN